MYLHEVLTKSPERPSGPTPDQADQAIADMERFIAKIYMPYRGAYGYGTERAILPEAPHIPHQENDAEHTFHIEKTVQFAYANREQYGLAFPDNFSINTARNYATTHDIIEIFAGDVDSLTKDKRQIANKADKEQAAALHMREHFPELDCIVDEWEEYEKKDSPEAQFVSDIDKVAATLVICVDGGRRWHNWAGHDTTKANMAAVVGDKICTRNGRALFDALMRRIDSQPGLFPEQSYIREHLFDVEAYESA